MSRTKRAFIIGPLWVPVLVTPFSAISMFPSRSQWFWVGATAFLSAMFAYLGTLAFGLPSFNFLASRKITSWWVAAVAGVIYGMATWVIFLIFFGLSLDGPYVGFATLLAMPVSAGSLIAPGFLGAIVSLTIWAIARPDRP